ncbi:hypothetical protein ACK34X_10270 [Aeromonas veronii]
MIDENGRLQFPPEMLRKFKRLLIESSDQVSINNSKCPNCNNVIKISEAFTKPCHLDSGITVPASDENGVMVGECSNCKIFFKVHVTNPEFSEFVNGAVKKDYYFSSDGDEKEILYKDLLSSVTKVGGDESLNKYLLDYVYDDYPLYVCKKCNENLEALSLAKFKGVFRLFQHEHNNYVNWSLKNARGPSPKYIIAKLNVRCSCGNECEAFFYKKYIETVSVDIQEFAICNINGALDIQDRIMSGVYSKDNSVSWLYKLIPRWTLLFDMIYIITPFVGHQWLKPTELMDVWLELVNRLDHKKSKVLLKYGQFASFKKAYSEENKTTYETLNDFELGADLLSEIKQTNDFHAKIYCGLRQDRCEVFSGSANLVRGKSMEVMHFNVINDFHSFNKAFLSPLGIKEELKCEDDSYSLLFDDNKQFNVFQSGSEVDYDEYKKIIFL